MIAWLKNLFRQPAPAELALRELQEARIAKLEAESGVDYAQSVVDYNTARIVRLIAYLDTLSKGTVK